MYGQTQIPEALMGAMLIEQGAQKGQFQPVTRDGQPTVAAQLMQRAAPQPAGVGQAMEQAGLAGQIQAMKMQQAQQAMMQQAMSQQQPQGMAGGGIAGLSTDIDGFADGGIVGYAGPDGSYVIEPEFGGSTQQSIIEDELRMEKVRQRRALEEYEKQRRRNMERVIADEEKTQEQAAVPSAQSALAKIPLNIPSGRTYSAESPSAGMFNAARARVGQMATEPVSPQQGIEASLAIREANDAYRRRLGMLTEMEEIKRQEDESRAFTAERQQMLDRRRQEAADKRQSEQLGRFLRGARGRTLGETLGAAEAAREAFDVGMLNQIRGFEDLGLQIKGLQIEKQNALNKMRNDIATGDFKAAMESKQKAQNAQNELLKAYADIDLAQGRALSQEASARMQATPQPGETERMMATYQRLLQQDPTGKAAQEYKNMIDMFKGAGRGTGERQDLLELKTLQQNLTKQLETVYGKDREPLIRQLEEVNARIAQMAGLPATSTGGSKSPAVGAIMDGYRFKGGNPADKNNWEKV